MSLADLTAHEAAAGIRRGEFKSVDLVEAFLARISEKDDAVQAWMHLDSDYALAQARGLDEARQTGLSSGALQGVPIGIKDIFDTRDLPTENGTVLDAGRQPTEDCTAVHLLRQAGAVIMGKTVSTELATYAPGKTRNPHNPDHTPGGSSSGSAAAVSASMVPLAIGSQTAGSVIRPAAFCGVYGYKPTHGLISRHGVLVLSRILDHVGVFGRCVADVALIGEVLMNFDAQDRDMKPRARPPLTSITAEEPPVTPQIAFVKPPGWDGAEEDTKSAFAELASLLGDACDEVDLPKPFESALDWHGIIMHTDLAKNLAGYYERGKDELSDVLSGLIEEGQNILAVDYNRAVDWIEVLNADLTRVFERYDAILTPAALGEAPAGLAKTGDPIFCKLWTLCGTPAVTLPILEGANSLPIGAQLVGPRGDDARLLRTARWLVNRVADEGGNEG
jgi:Asp-tRNA(Asn)/Glu-tRNA(Gln) amidotransferase A subunit family amidase